MHAFYFYPYVASQIQLRYAFEDYLFVFVKYYYLTIIFCMDKDNVYFWTLFFVVTMGRLFLATRLGLAEDEAYYWDWSRHLDWSYLDHPGMTAWLIALSEKVIPNSSPLSVRMPALILNTGIWYLVWQITSRFFGSSAALVASLLYLLIPIYSLGGLMMVPDLPMSLCWMIVLWIVASRLLDFKVDQRWTWLAIGLFMGLGFLSKYTMALLGVSVLIFVVSTKELRGQLKTPWPWVAFGIFLACCTPIIIWNAQNHWESFYYQFVIRQRSNGLDLKRWLTFILSQIGILTPVIFGLFCWAAAFALKNIQDIRWRFTVCFAFPTLLIFTLQAAFAEFKMHWTSPGYIPLLFATGFLWTKTSPNVRQLVAIAALLLLIPINILFYVGTTTPIAPWFFEHLPKNITNKISPWEPKWDPTNDLYGWPQAGARAQALRLRLINKERSMPFLASYRYQLTSQLAFATKDNVLSLSPLTEFYDFIQSKEELNELKGRAALVVTDNKYDDIKQMSVYFDSCKKVDQLKFKRGSYLAHVFDFWLCEPFLGEPDPEGPSSNLVSN
jgi:hypothetical protein